MNKKMLKTILFATVCTMLIAAMALCMTSCKSKTTETPQTNERSDVQKVGEGKTQFKFEVYDGEGNVTAFEVSTDKQTVGDALLELKLIEGDNDQYGLYVKKVNGITADYNVDQTYWAFYVNGAYATAGVDATDIEAGAIYAFKVEK